MTMSYRLRRTVVERVGDLLYGVADEIRPFANAHAAFASKSETVEGSTVYDLINEVEADLVDACEGVHPKKSDGLERRAALVRLAARTMVLLARRQAGHGATRRGREREAGGARSDE